MKLCAISVLATSCLFAFDESPWLGDVYGFISNTELIYSQYRHIDHAQEQPTYMYRNYLTREGIYFTMGDEIEVEWEIEFAQTPHQPYSFRSSGLCGKYCFLNDIEGNPISFVAGVNIRGVSGRAVRDVSSPYASYCNAEAMLSVGKEFTKDKNWNSRGYVTGVVGLANKGSIWNRFLVVGEGRVARSHIFKGFFTGYFGYGPQEEIDIEEFQGWGRVAHRSLDIGAQYRYHFALWGDLGISYAYRVFAKSYPSKEQAVTISYELPFSLF